MAGAIAIGAAQQKGAHLQQEWTHNFNEEPGAFEKEFK